MSITADVERSLKNLNDARSLRRVVVSTLGYDDRGVPVDTTEWKQELRGEIDGQPTLLASGGQGGAFVVVHTKLASHKGTSLGTQRRVVERLQGDYPNALYVFSDATDTVWHFVNVPYANESAYRPQYRRIVVSPENGYRTATERISMLSLDELAREKGKEPDSLSPLEIQLKHDEAFDVAAVTKQFFSEYREVFEDVLSKTEGIEDTVERRYFVQRMFNRLMFVAFVQKKGWLKINGRTDYLPALWTAHTREGSGGSFYEERLKPLFFEGFNRESGREEVDPAIGAVPYLNGGLFEADDYDEDPSVGVPDECFDRIINRLFARYNFTTTESTPLEVEVAVDPEMLGKVFEELVTGRHDTGSYYTPKPIVSFMCREAIKGYLGEKLGVSSDEDREAIRKFVDARDPSSITDPEAALEALKTMRVCDPACGSGAYLLGMLRELLDLRESLFVTHNVDSARTYDRKLEIIQYNIYGVDLEQFATNIARLRLWLSLIVDFDGPAPPPLPNLDFKIGVGDSLAAPNPSGGFGNLDMFREQQIEDHVALKSEYLRAHGEEKADLKTKINEMRADIAEWAHPGTRVQGFDWQVEFSEVFSDESRRGFDVILANPPYVRMELFKEIKPTLRKNFPEAHSDRADLYVYFYARALQLLNNGGGLSFISSNKWFRAGYGKKLRKHIADICHVSSITDFGDLPVFQGASAYPMIFAAQKGHNGIGGPTSFTQVKSLDPPYPDVVALIRSQGSPLPDGSITGPDWSLTDAATADRLKKMRASGVPLGEYVKGQIYYGIKTGFNKAFVIDGAKREELISQDPKSAEVIKPFLTGKNIRKWYADTQDKWLLYMHHDVNTSGMNAVIEHLEPFREDLEGRATQQEWYELQQPQMRYASAFEKPKIVFPDIAKEPRFAFDTSEAYAGNTAYVVPVDDKYLLGVLNSSSVRDFYVEISSQVRGGYLRFIYQYIEQIPIPNAPAAKREAIAALVEKCLGAKGVGCEEWEREIDERVAALYGLDLNDLNGGA